LLPADQPDDALQRLAVLPGITGWAQINGGNLIERDEKGGLDEWYVAHASFWLDMRIILSTIVVVVTGDRKSAAIDDYAGGPRRGSSAARSLPHSMNRANSDPSPRRAPAFLAEWRFRLRSLLR